MKKGGKNRKILLSLAKFSGLSIAQKIGYGYGLVIAIAVLGTTAGLMIGNHYQSLVQRKQIVAERQQQLLNDLETSVLAVRSHPQQLFTVKEDSIWFTYETSKFKLNIERVQDLLSELEIFIDNNAAEFPIEDPDFKEFIQDYRKAIKTYTQIIETLWSQIDPVHSVPEQTISSEQQILQSIQGSAALSNSIILDRLAETLLRATQSADAQLERAAVELTQANALQQQVIAASILLSGIIAAVLALYTTRTITRPIQQVTAVANKITKQSDFSLQAPITTQDEVGVLAETLNQLVQQVQRLLASQAAEVEHQKRLNQDLQIATQAAEAANQAKTQFLANMSHELRTPLNGVLGYAQILKRDPDIGPKQQEGLNTIEQCGSHLLTLINDILDLAKVEAGKLELMPEDFHFLNFLENVVEIFHLHAKKQALEFIYQPGSSLPIAIHADKKRLRQVLLNLLSNAMKFTDKGGITFRVEILGTEENSQDSTGKIPSAKPAGSPYSKFCHIRFQVTDTGIGIAPDHLERICLPFEQVGSRDRQSQGTGLGLAITQRILQLMGSTLQLESTMGQGSTFGFELDLPIAEGWLSTSQPSPGPTIVGYYGVPKRILVVDDRSQNRSVLNNLLVPLGFDILEAASGQEGLALTIQAQPDLIIVDLAMPQMDGLEMTRRICQHSDLATVPIIACSEKTFSHDLKASQAAGCDDFVAKPVQAPELLEKLQQHLKLEWEYSPETTGGQKPIPARSLPTSSITPPTAPLIIPPTEVIQRWRDLILKGNYQGLIKQLEQLEQSNAQYHSVTSHLRHLARAFQEQELLRLLSQYQSQRQESGS